MLGRKLTQPYTLLKEREEKRFEEFFHRFSRSGTTLSFSEFIMFSIDRSIIHNKIGLSILQNYFDIAFKQSIPQDKQIKQEEKSLIPGIIVERGIMRHQFNFLLAQLSYYIYHNDKNHLDRLLNEILAEKTLVSKEQTTDGVRNLIYDEVNKRILNEQCIILLNKFENEIKNIFTIYMQENLEQKNIMLKWKELAVQNKKMSTPALIRFLRDADIVPHLLSIEQFEEIMMKIIPPTNNKEHEFYSRGHVVHVYERDEKPSNRIEGDPMLLIHEFQLLLARIAFEHCLKDEIKDQRRDPDRIHKFLSEVLYLRTNEQQGIKALPSLNKKHLQNLERYQSVLTNNSGDEDQEVIIKKGIEVKENLVTKMAELQQQQIFDKRNSPNSINILLALQSLDMPLDIIIKMLDKELPATPPIPDTNRQMDKWDPDGRVVIGDPLPIPPGEKGKGSQKAKPAARAKPGEPQQRKIIFEETQVAPKNSEEYQQELVDKLNYDQKLLSSIERGTLSEIQVIPVLIPEILYPNPPALVRTDIEAAMCAHNEGNFIFAIQNYDEAKKKWMNMESKDISDGIEVYFEFQKASVYESAGRDDMALQGFLNARSAGNKLPPNSPDKALAYCGIGLVMYNTEEWEWALRSFLQARQIRERLLGVETVDTATTFNNLGCCMYMLDRNQEAYAYFKLAHAVLEEFLGPHHTRTMTAARNLMKTNKNYFDNQPAYKKLWVTYVSDKFGTVAKKGKKGKKGKK